MGGGVIFNGYFNVNTTSNVIQNFYYVNNKQYVDILLTNNGGQLGDYACDNVFQNGNFTNNGTNLLPVIPYINTTYSAPSVTKIQLLDYVGYISYSIAYSNNNIFNSFEPPDGWEISPINFTFTFNQISGLPPLSVPSFFMGSLFSNNAMVYYKPHSLSTGGGGSGVRNYRKKQRKT